MKFPPYIERPLYLDRILPFVKKDIMKILVGQRRVGKSYMLFQLMDRIADLDPNGQQIYISKELDEFAQLHSHRELLDTIADRRKTDRHLYLFIDEVQEIKDFEKALRSLQAGGGVDIYATGSNARLLSGELATGLSGRYIEIRIHGLTYPEFVAFHGLSAGRESFGIYLKLGGLPYLRHLPTDESIVFEYLRNITDAILLKDVVARYDIRNVSFLLRLGRFLADNVGSLVTARKISDYLKSQKVNVSHNLVLDYLGYLCNAMLVTKVGRMDIVGKKMFEIGEKYYFEDLGLRHALVGYRAMDISKILENIAFLHLRAAGYEVRVGQVGTREVDFVAEKGGDRLYVQVAYLLADEAVRQREFGNLAAIPDNFPKVVVTMDEIAGGSLEGIRHMHIQDFVRSIF